MAHGANIADSAPYVFEGAKMKWPPYSNLVYGPSGEVGILAQSDEVRAVVRRAIVVIEEFIIFENGFPDIATRAAWARKALLKAVNQLTQSKLTDHGHYLFLKKRLKEDPEYVRDLSSVVREIRLSAFRSDLSSKLEQRISNFRRNLKITAAAAVRAVFLLHLKPLPPDDADTLVKDVTNYICPLAANVSGS
jgi:hypothetical protein